MGHLHTKHSQDPGLIKYSQDLDGVFSVVPLTSWGELHTSFQQANWRADPSGSPISRRCKLTLVDNGQPTARVVPIDGHLAGRVHAARTFHGAMGARDFGPSAYIGGPRGKGSSATWLFTTLGEQCSQEGFQLIWELFMGLFTFNTLWKH